MYPAKDRITGLVYTNMDGISSNFLLTSFNFERSEMLEGSPLLIFSWIASFGPKISVNFEKFEKWMQWVFGLKLGNGTPFENFEKLPLDQWNIINSINTHYQIK